jgi:hypothetical protein
MDATDLGEQWRLLDDSDRTFDACAEGIVRRSTDRG